MKMQKRQFRIGQLAAHLGVERFVVRFWEKEFKLTADRSLGGQRFYSDHNLALFKKIKELLYEKGFTISGAKKQLRSIKGSIIASQKTTMNSVERTAADHTDYKRHLTHLKNQLLHLKASL